MLKKNCHKVLESQKSKLILLELVFKRAGTIKPPPIQDRVKLGSQYFWNKIRMRSWFFTPDAFS